MESILDILEISLNNKEVIECNEKSWTFDPYDWHSPSFKFKFLSRKENTFVFEVWKKELELNYSGNGTFISKSYTPGNWKLKGISEVSIPIETINRQINYKNLLLNEIAPLLRYEYRR